MKDPKKEGPGRRVQEEETFAGGFWKTHVGELRFRGALGRPGRLLSGRLLPGTDLVEGILEMARSFGIREGIVFCFGSLARARFSTGVRPVATSPEMMERIPSKTLEGPVEFLCGQGKLGLPLEGAPVFHLHGVVVTPEGLVTGGHFFAGENPVFATLEVVIQEILGIQHQWKDDDETGVTLIESIQKPL